MTAEAEIRLAVLLGGRTRTRTLDPLIKSQLLYHRAMRRFEPRIFASVGGTKPMLGRQFLTAINEINHLVQTVDQEVGGSSPPSCTKLSR